LAAIALLLLGALTSSFIAPLSKLTADLSPAVLLTLASALAAVGHLAFVNPLRRAAYWMNRRAVGVALLGGAVLTWSYVIFAWAIQSAQNAFLPTFAFELYPLGIILFSNLLIRTEGVGLVQALWLSLSVIGLLLLGLDATRLEMPGGADDAPTLEGAFRVATVDSSFYLGCVAVVLLAVGMTLVSKAAGMFGLEAGASAFSSFVARIGGVLAVGPAALYLADWSRPLSQVDLVAIAIYGLVILTISNIAYYRGVALAKSHLINAIWNIAPVLSVVWLYLLGAGELTTLIGVGAACIIVSNLMLNLRVEARLSYTLTIVWILAAGSAIYFFEGAGNTEYYDAVAGPLLFLGLLFGFLVDRLIRRTESEHQLVLRLLSAVDEASDLREERRIAAREAVLAVAEGADAQEGRAAYRALLALEPTRGDGAAPTGRGGPAAQARETLDALLLSKAQGVSVGEALVLALIAALTNALALSARPNDFSADVFALVVSTGVVFTVATVYDLVSIRRGGLVRRIEAFKRDALQRGGDDSPPSEHVALESSKLGERIVIGLLMGALTLIFVVLFYLKSAT
ncbi:MAG: DMT family transporter, partial [Pseudomonadota bacterium]